MGYSLRKKKINLTDIPEEESFTSHFISEDNPEEALADQEMESLVLKLINLLPVQYKTVLTLYHVEGMNYGEIGEVTECRRNGKELSLSARKFAEREGKEVPW